MGVFAALIALMAVAIPASATKVHLFKEAFGSAAQPSFGTARSVAIDQSTGDVLVMDAGGTPSIKRYNPDGTAANFSGLGTNVIDGKGNGECATVPADCDETPQNGLSFDSASESQIAVDNSGTATDGDIYVTQGSPNLINIFSSEGKYLGQLTESSTGAFNEACGVAVDPSGAVYVGDYSGGIHKFIPAANPPVKADNTANFSTVTQPCQLAAGTGPTAGFLFAAQFNGAISKLDSGTGEVKYVVSPSPVQVLAADPGTGHVLGSNGNSATEFDASGAGSATTVANLSFNNSVQGLATRGSTGNLYVSTFGNSQLEVFGPLVSLPNVTSGSASAIQPTSATLNGTVNPEAVLLSECKFEYGKTAAYGDSVPCSQSNAAIGSGASNVAVSAPIAGLEVGTTYHFRLVAKNTNGTTSGSDKTLLTAGPVLADVWTGSVLRTEATLDAKINPEGNATTYRIEWGQTTAYGSSTGEISVGSDGTTHTVAKTIEGLSPGTTYHWRLVATNSAAANVGPDLTFTTYPTLVQNTSCPNQDLRTGANATLPDCRAYEMVTPVDKNGGDIATLCNIGCFRTAIDQASLNGDKMTYSSYKAFGDALGSYYSNQYIATRTDAGWQSHSLNPHRLTGTIFGPLKFDSVWDLDVQFKAFTPDLSTTWITDDSKFPLTADAQEGYVNVYRRNNLTDAYEALTNTEPTLSNEGKKLGSPQFQGYSADGRHAVFAAAAALTPDAAPNEEAQIYDFSNGELHLVSVLPNGTADPARDGVGASTDERSGNVTHAISDDGSHIFWSSGVFSGNTGTLFVRVDGKETIRISKFGVKFLTATSDGSRALYEEGNNIYMFDVDQETTTKIAGQTVGLLGASEDLSNIYFVSKEVLAPGAVAESRNLYRDHNGSMSLVAILSAIDTGEGTAEQTLTDIPAVSGYNDVSEAPLNNPSRVTPDGLHIAFQSTRRLTGYDNTDASSGEPDVEVFTYDAPSQQLTCVSCNPGGARPAGKVLQLPFKVIDSPANNNGEPARRWAAAWLTTSPNQLHTPRTLADSGDILFFNSFDSLLPQDTNGVQDVYEWEAQGSGDCDEAGGCLSLISTGKSPTKSEFIDASPNGEDVFIETNSSIDLRDPGLIDIYDAKVDGGFPYAPETSPCVGDSCQPAPAPPNDPTPASAGFKGAGNLAPRADCSGAAKQAAGLSRAARRLRGDAERVDSGQAKRMRQKAQRFEKRARGLQKSAKRCRRASRRAER